MSELASSVFEHPIADVIIQTLVEGRTSAYAMDDAGVKLVLEAATEALKSPEAQQMLDTIVDVADFLDEQDGAQASARLMELLDEIEGLANAEPAQYEGFDDDDGVELTFGRRAASIVGEKQVLRAPGVDDVKPHDALSLQALIGAKRRI